MNNNSVKEISLKRLKQKDNIIFGIFMVLLMIILYILLTIVYFAIKYKSDTYKYNINSRIIIVENKNIDNDILSKEVLDSLSSIEHVIMNISEKYYNGFYQKISEFNINGLDGDVTFNAIYDKNMIKIYHGKIATKDNEVVIPINFYPTANDDQIDRDKIVKGDQLIGKTINIYSDKYLFEYDENDKEKQKEHEKIWNSREKNEFKIVGTYESELGMYSRNTCFVTKNAIDKLKPNHNGSDVEIIVGGDSIYTSREYGRMLVIDKYKNVEKVHKYLIDNNYSAYPVFSFDETEYKLILYIPIVTSIIVLIILFIIIRYLINKKIKTNYNYIGLLETFGFNEKEIEKIFKFEILYLISFCFVISFIIYSLLFLIMNKYSYIFKYVDYYGSIIKMPYIYIIVLCIILCIFIVFVNKKCIKKCLKNSIINLLNGE